MSSYDYFYTTRTLVKMSHGGMTIATIEIKLREHCPNWVKVEGQLLYFSHLVFRICSLIQVHVHGTRLILAEVLTELMKMTITAHLVELRDQLSHILS